jgi:hypothetical protein
LVLGLLLAFSTVLIGPVRASAVQARTPVTLTLFWGDGCPKCESERHFLRDLQRDQPQLTVQQYEVWQHSGNRDRFERVAREHGVSASVVPMTIVADRVWIGFTDAIRDDIRRAVEIGARGGQIPSGVYGRSGTGTCTSTQPCEVQQKPRAEVDVPLVGRVDVGDKSLLVSTLVIGFVDGINPCSLWVISILLAIVIRTGSRRRVIAIGTAFLLVTAVMYAIYMAGMYSTLTVVSYLGTLQLVVGLAAAVMGTIAVKDYFWFKRGVSLTIPEGRKPGLYKRMREVAAGRRGLADRDALHRRLPAAVDGAAQEQPRGSGRLGAAVRAVHDPVPARRDPRVRARRDDDAGSQAAGEARTAAQARGGHHHAGPGRHDDLRAGRHGGRRRGDPRLRGGDRGGPGGARRSHALGAPVPGGLTLRAT